MKILIAIDSFKGSLSSLEAGNAVARSAKEVFGDVNTVVMSIADGGEGTVASLVSGMGGNMESVTLSDPLGRPITAKYGTVKERNLAIIEMSAAAGITLLSERERDPLKTSTYGVGEMIRDAILKGYRNFIMGIGGSATNDGGVGMLQALGFGFFDSDGESISRSGAGLENINDITFDAVMKELKECTFHVACDVKNPLCGDNGCSAVFGPQKGADALTVKKMDQWLLNYSNLCKSYFPDSNPNYPGAGAAGGMGYALKTFLNAELIGGVELVLREIGFEREIADADLVITGEGRLDSQTVMGKVPFGVASLAKKYGKPVLAFSGIVSRDATICNACGIDAFFPILRRITSLDEALDPQNACSNLEETSLQVFRLIKTIKQIW